MALAEEFRRIEGAFTGKIEIQAPLSRFSYYRIGGKAEVLAEPRTFEDLVLLHEILGATGAPFFVFGWGSNLLFPDHDLPGVMIRMKHLYTGIEERTPGVLRVGASLGANALLRVASEKGYGGLSRFTGIPGSIGGMIAMNAGTHLGEMSGVLLRTEWVELGNHPGPLEVRTRDAVPADFSYRRNHFLPADALILHAEIRFLPEDPEKVRAEIDALYRRRKESQPVEYPSCGSVFMNPREAGLRAWEVVDRLGYRGKRIGGAQVSEKHPNFIVNLGGATAADVTTLIRAIQQEAREKLGIELHEEVRILG